MEETTTFPLRHADTKPHARAGLAAALRFDGALVLLYVVATWLTAATYMGDTLYYANSVLGMASGQIAPSAWEPRGNYSFFEFGHLLWRPLGCLCYLLLTPLMRRFFAGEPRNEAIFVLVVLNWVAGLVSVLLLRRVLGFVAQRTWVVTLGTVGFVFTYGFLNFTQTGSSYVPALALYLLGLYLVLRSGERAAQPLRTALVAGAALAGAVCLWFPYVWVVPAALAAPLILFGDSGARRRLFLYGALASGGMTILVYAVAVVGGLHIHDLATFKAWVASSAHGLDNNRGLLQVVFGLARTFLSVGHDNVLLKRFLLHDPYNPVSPFALFRLSLWKLALFYLALAATVLLLSAGGRGRRVLVLLILSSLPVVAFAALWQGTPPERYLPLYPAAFMALACALEVESRRAWLKALVLAFVAALVVGNVFALATWTLAHRQAQMVARTKDLVPLLTRQSVVVEVKEELKDLQWEFPLHPLNRQLTVYSAVSIGDRDAARWRTDFAAKTFETWRAGGDVWLSRRVLEPRPRAASYWVEGSDPGISWAQISAFFNQLERGQEVGGADGFVLLPPTPYNTRVLSALNNEQLTTSNGQSR